MMGSSPLPPDVFFPTRSNPQFSLDDGYLGQANYEPCFFPPTQQEIENPQPKRPRLSNESPHPHHPNYDHGVRIPTMQPQNGRNTPFFKTRICNTFQQGRCALGKDCTYAHGAWELRQPPPNWQEIVLPKEPFADAAAAQPLAKKICRRFERGDGCSYGDKCSFLHDGHGALLRKDVGTQRFWDLGSGCVDNSTRAVCPSIGSGNGNEQKTAFWKTKPCYRFESNGHCPNGDRCQYAHGPGELKTLGGDTSIARPNLELAPTRTLPDQACSAPPADMQIDCVHETVQDKKLTAWKGPKKLSLIYGDWIY